MAERIEIPSTDLKVSKLCLGCWQFNGGQANINWDSQSVETSKSILDEAIKCGVNFIDTAEAYGGSEETLGKILDGRRKDLVIATKFGYRPGKSEVLYSATDVEVSLTASLQKLKTDYIDLYQIHWPNIVGSASEIVSELERQKSLGRIRYYGLCNFGPQNLEEFLSAGGKPVTQQLPYNLLTRSIEYEVLPMCYENNISILPYSPLMQGLLTGKFRKLEDVPEGRRRTRHFSSTSTKLSRHGEAGCEKQMFKAIDEISEISNRISQPMGSVSLAWLLQQRNVVSVIAGASRADQIERNLKIPTLEPSVVDELRSVTEAVKSGLGSNIDLYSPESRCK